MIGMHIVFFDTNVLVKLIKSPTFFSNVGDVLSSESVLRSPAGVNVTFTRLNEFEFFARKVPNWSCLNWLLRLVTFCCTPRQSQTIVYRVYKTIFNCHHGYGKGI